jgi:hypothetical protein
VLGQGGLGPALVDRAVVVVVPDLEQIIRRTHRRLYSDR